MRRLRLGCAFVVGLLGSASPGLAWGSPESEAREKARWIPGASIFSMGNPEKREARASSDALDDLSGKSTGFPWAVGGSAEIASPVVVDIPGRPRFYFHADVAYATEGEDVVLSQGDPGPTSIFGTVPVVQSIRGVGQAIRTEIKPLLLTGGIGTVWSFEAFDRTFRVRPSVEWMYQRQTVKAILGAGENEGVDPALCEPCRLLFIESETEKGYHSVGPGLELEMVAGRAGDFLLSFYASGRAYRILGPRKANAGGRGLWQRTDGLPTTRPSPTTDFRATFKRRTWHYRFGFGLRFSWLPQ